MVNRSLRGLIGGFLSTSFSNIMLSLSMTSNMLHEDPPQHSFCMEIGRGYNRRWGGVRQLFGEQH